MMDYVWATWVFHARPHDDRLAILDPAPDRAIYPSNLALDPNRVSLKTGKTVAIHPDLAVNEIHEIAENA
jgi:hypothetical protein